MPLQIEQKRVDPDITILAVAGRLGLGRECQQLETLVDELANSGKRKLVLDLSGVDHIDSAGIGSVAMTAGKLKEAGGRCVVVATDGRVMQMLNVTQMNAIVTICSTSQAAAAAFA